MLKVNLSHQALKFLKKVPVKHGQQIARTISMLQEKPVPHDAKRLKGNGEYLRVDIGEYRVIYRVDSANELLIVALIGKRNDAEVYKQFKRKG